MRRAIAETDVARVICGRFRASVFVRLGERLGPIKAEEIAVSAVSTDHLYVPFPYNSSLFMSHNVRQ